MKKICVIPGDGVGLEVIPPAAEAISILSPDFKMIDCEAGLDNWKRTGSFLSEDVMEILEEADAILFGAITSPPPGTDYTSPLLWMRKHFELYANLRPIRSFRSNFDVTIIRENTEGLYSGAERYEEGRYITERVLTEKGLERITRFALNYAEKRNKRLTAAHKANVLRKSDAAFRRIFYEMAVDTEVEANDMFIDAVTHELVVNPERFDVFVTLNMYGDILSDLAAALGGGLGLAPSANIGDKKALFEPVHGSAPDIAGKGIANPTAAFLSAAMLLDYFGREEGERLREAVESVIKGGHGTPDMGGADGTAVFARRILERITD